MYSIIVVEDDFMERSILKKIILSVCESVEIYEADNQDSALEIIKEKDINLFLIDINLKQSSGLDLAMKIREISKYEFRQIVFLTTHLEYITQAFKQTHCYDYIIKPYDHDEVKNMISKIIFNEESGLNSKEEKEIVITLKSGVYIGIKVKDILFIEVNGKNCEINTIHGVYTASSMSLKKIMNLIDCNYIVQSHRAFAININYINKIEKLDVKLSEIYFYNYSKTALLGYKFKNEVISQFKKDKVIIC